MQVILGESAPLKCMREGPEPETAVLLMDLFSVLAVLLGTNMLSTLTAKM